MRMIILELVHGQGEKKKCEYERDGITKIFNKGSLFEELILLNIHKKNQNYNKNILKRKRHFNHRIFAYSKLH